MTDFAAARLAMVDCQVRPSDVTAYPIIDAMLSVRKEEFVPAAMRSVAYADAPIAYSPGRAIPDARVLGKMLDAVRIGPEDLVLDIGCGTGYVAAILGRLSAAVVAVEPDEELAATAAETLAAHEAMNVVVEQAELTAGAPDHGPYDVIFVEGGVETVPAEIVEQLKMGGRIVAVVMDGRVGQARVGLRSASGLSWRRAFDATAPVLPGFEAKKAFEF